MRIHIFVIAQLSRYVVKPDDPENQFCQILFDFSMPRRLDALRVQVDALLGTIVWWKSSIPRMSENHPSCFFLGLITLFFVHIFYLIRHTCLLIKLFVLLFLPLYILLYIFFIYSILNNNCYCYYLIHLKFIFSLSIS